MCGGPLESVKEIHQAVLLGSWWFFFLSSPSACPTSAHELCFLSRASMRLRLLSQCWSQPSPLLTISQMDYTTIRGRVSHRRDRNHSQRARGAFTRHPPPPPPPPPINPVVIDGLCLTVSLLRTLFGDGEPWVAAFTLRVEICWFIRCHWSQFIDELARDALGDQDLTAAIVAGAEEYFVYMTGLTMGNFPRMGLAVIKTSPPKVKK